MALFQKSKDNVFQNVLGLNYGYLYIEDYRDPQVILAIDEGLEVFRTYVNDEFFTTEDETVFIEEMRRAEILNTQLDVLNTVRRFLLPIDYFATLRFEVCVKCKPPEPIHGFVEVEKTGYIVHGPIFSMAKGFQCCNSMVSDDRVTALNAVTVLKQILASNLPLK